MIFSETKLKGAFLIEPERIEDHRGFFARTWCQQEFESLSLNSKLVQCSISFNKIKGTLRGMHFQVAPFEETKLVRCTKGEIFDVIIDLRPNSETFKKHFSAILNEDNRLMLYIPGGFAHGFQTMADNTEVFYQMTQFYSPDHSSGVRWNDPAFGIQWPPDDRIIIDRDLNYPDFTL
ncbi:dTDP-4-dehydrorhamnose 3,5-epimerase [bacterium]|nr:dTDP-4-dehydrorhamnose 3,5-epimerase [bacterium]